MDLAQKPVYKLDLAAGTSVVNLTTPLVEGDDRAQTFNLELTDKGAPANLNGYSVTAYFGRGKTAEAEADTIPLSGTVSGNVATITLTESCYSRSCYFSMPIRLSNGATGQKRTYLIVRGTVVKSVDGKIIDPDGSVPSLDDLFAQIAVMERSRQAAEEATEDALAAAARADEAREGIQGDLDALTEEVLDLATIKAGSLVQWRRGGLYASGKIYVDQSRNRIVSTLVSLHKGDVISSADGYALAVNFYSHYTSDDDFNMITRQAMTEEPIIVPVDCVAFIGAKRTNDAAFTADDILMGNHFVHIPDQNKGVSEMLMKGAEEAAFRDIADIPVNALAYYDKWEQEIPTSKYAYIRELLCYADGTVNYPVYLYRFDLYNNWIDNNYAYNNYTPAKGNALYRKPRILVTSGIHGNERATPVSVMAFAKNIIENPAYAHLLGQYDWYLVPLVNPWGFSHSVISNSTGEVVYNNSPSWTNDTLPNGYSIIENTPTQCGGIRRNASSMDINRDFSDVQYVYNTNTYGFATPEAQAILTAAQTYGFDMVFDLHQSFDAATAGSAPKCGYVRMQYAPRSGEPAAERVAFYREASAVNAKVDNYFREMYGNGVSKPMSLIWNGGTNPSIMNYFGGYEASDGTGNSANKDLACAYSFCVETSQVCYPLSQYDNGWYNVIANHYTNVYCAELMRGLSELN